MNCRAATTRLLEFVHAQEELLGRWQIQSYLHGNADMKPQILIIKRVLDAIAKSFGPLVAEELLGRLE